MNKVTPGEAVEIRAKTWNSFIDAANYVQNVQKSGGKPRANTLPAGIIYVKNDSENEMEVFSVMSLPNLVFPPDEEEDNFQFSDVIFSAKEYTEENNEKPLCILQEPLEPEGVGRALVLGVTHGKVEVSDIAHNFAVPSPDTPGKLISAESGAIEIMWKGIEPGEQDCILKMGGSGGAGDFSYPFKLYTKSDEEGVPFLCMKQGRIELQTLDTRGVNFRVGESESFLEDDRINFDFSAVPDGDYIVMGWVKFTGDGMVDCGVLIGGDEMNSSYEYPNGCGFFTFTIGVVTKQESEDGKIQLAVSKQLACGTFSITDRYLMLPFVPYVDVTVPSVNTLAKAGSIQAVSAKILNAPCYFDSIEKAEYLTDGGTSLDRGKTYYAYIEDRDNVVKIIWETEEKKPYEIASGSENPNSKIKRTLVAKIIYQSDGNFQTYPHHLAPYRGGGDTYKVKINNAPPHIDSIPDFLELKLQGDASSDADKEKYPDKGYIKHIVQNDPQNANSYFMKTVWDYKGISGYSDSAELKTLITVKSQSGGDGNSGSLKWDDYGKIRSQESDKRPDYLQNKVTAGRNIEFVWTDDKLKIESRSLMAGEHISMQDKNLDDGHRYTVINALPPNILAGKYLKVTKSSEDNWTIRLDSKLEFAISDNASWLLSLTDEDGHIEYDTKIGAPPEDDEYYLSSKSGRLRWSKGGNGTVKVCEDDELDYLENQFDESDHIEFLSDGDMVTAWIKEDAFESPTNSVLIDSDDTFMLDVNWSQIKLDPSLQNLIDIEYLNDGSGIVLKSALSGNGVVIMENGTMTLLEGEPNCLLACTGDGSYSWIPYSTCENACESEGEGEGENESEGENQ